MKKTIIIFICLVIVFLCSCGNTASIYETSNFTNQDATKENYQADIDETKSQSAIEFTTVEIKTSPDDPYSYIVKEKYEKIVRRFQEEDISDHFFEFDKYAGNCYFFLYDIDGNGIDELILGDWKLITNDSEDSNAPKKITVSSIYTIKNGQVAEQSVHPWWDNEVLWDRVILTNGLIRTGTGYKDYPSYSYMGFENGEFGLKYSISYLGDGKGNKRYKKIYRNDNGEYVEEIITKEIFEQLRDEADGDSDIVEIKWKRIDEYGR